MEHTPTVVEITEESEQNETTETPVSNSPRENPVKTIKQLTQNQKNLKQLSKRKAKYQRQLLKSESVEDSERFKKLITNIDNYRYMIKLSKMNKNTINKVLAFIDYPMTIQEIQDSITEQIESDNI